MENGKRGLSVKKAKVLARVYGCVWEELFEDDENDGLDGSGHSGAVQMHDAVCKELSSQDAAHGKAACGL